MGDFPCQVRLFDDWTLNPVNGGDGLESDLDGMSNWEIIQLIAKQVSQTPHLISSVPDRRGWSSSRLLGRR